MLALQVGGPLHGLSVNAEPGWESVEMNEPGEGRFMLLAGHQVGLQRVAGSPGFSMYDLSLSPILDTDLATYTFSADVMGNLHEDLFFAAPGLGDYTLTLKLIDPSGIHAESAPFTLTFVAVPEPTGLALVLAGGVAAVARRRP